MADQRKYLLDTNVFIEAHQRYYGFDLCPGFWTAIVRQHHENRVFSIDRVKQEIAKGKDKLDKWAQLKAPDTFFKKTDNKAVIDQFGKMIEWVQGESQYASEAKAAFARAADGWLIAYAKSRWTYRGNARGLLAGCQSECADPKCVSQIRRGIRQYF